MLHKSDHANHGRGRLLKRVKRGSEGSPISSDPIDEVARADIDAFGDIVGAAMFPLRFLKEVLKFNLYSCGE